MADPFTIAAVVSAVGTGLQAVGQIRAGQAANKAAKYQANQMEVNAGQARASSQRTAIERKRQSTLLASQAQAIGAAQGSALDPTTANIISGIEGEGQYGALTALYQGEETARGNIAQAGATRFEGKQAKQQGYMNAAATAGSFAAKYAMPVFGSDDPGAMLFGTQSPAPIEYR